jgi:1-acyl-sn-glycerol-3-phosphate acyltransferase
VRGECDDGCFAARLAQVAQGGRSQVVVAMRESRPALVGERVGTRWTASSPPHRPSALDLDQETVGDQAIQMTPHGRGGQAEALREHGRRLWSLLEDEPGDRIAGAPFSALGHFHNTSMTYFPAEVLLGSPGGSSTFPSVLYRSLELTVSPALRAIFRPDVDGAENVPRDGSVIIAGNHVSFADEVFTPLAARRQVYYLAKAEYFDSPGIRGRAMAAVFEGLGQVPVRREVARSAAASLDLCVDLLAQGRAFGIYPEGTRSRDGRLYKFRTGVARIALRSGAPVVPVGLVGTRDVLEPGSRRWHRRPVAVRFGAPLDFAGRTEDERSARKLREVTEEIRLAVQRLTGQEYVDSYATSNGSDSSGPGSDS